MSQNAIPIQPNLPAVELTVAVPSQNPLDYVSPQAAIAVLGPASAQVVYSAWVAWLATQIANGSIVSQQDAINQGLPPAVVSELWHPAAAAATQPPTPSGSWLDQTSFGIQNLWLAIGAGIFVLHAVTHQKRAV